MAVSTASAPRGVGKKWNVVATVTSPVKPAYMQPSFASFVTRSCLCEIKYISSSSLCNPPSNDVFRLFKKYYSKKSSLFKFIQLMKTVNS